MSPLQVVPDDYFVDGTQDWFAILSGLDQGKRLFYFDEKIADRPNGKTVLFIHGNPECSYTWRDVIAEIRKFPVINRIVAVDHIGFGLSDPADFEMVEMHHAANLIQFVRHLDLNDVVLVVHDWGGPIGIGALLRDAARVVGLVVVNSTVFPMPQTGLTYDEFPFRWFPWSKSPRRIPDIFWPSFAAFVVTRGEPQNSARFTARVLRAIIKDVFRSERFKGDDAEFVFAQMLRQKINTLSSKRNVLQTPYWGHGYQYVDKRHGVQDNQDFYDVIQRNIGSQWSKVPVRGLFGAWDPCGKNEVINQWCEALPQMQSTLRTFENRGHFLEEHEPKAVAEAIREVAIN